MKHLTYEVSAWITKGVSQKMRMMKELYNEWAYYIQSNMNYTYFWHIIGQKNFGQYKISFFMRHPLIIGRHRTHEKFTSLKKVPMAFKLFSWISMSKMKGHEKVIFVVMFVTYFNFHEAKILPCPQSVESRGISW